MTEEIKKLEFGTDILINSFQLVHEGGNRAALNGWMSGVYELNNVEQTILNDSCEKMRVVSDYLKEKEKKMTPKHKCSRQCSLLNTKKTITNPLTAVFCSV